MVFLRTGENREGEGIYMARNYQSVLGERILLHGKKIYLEKFDR